MVRAFFVEETRGAVGNADAIGLGRSPPALLS